MQVSHSGLIEGVKREAVFNVVTDHQQLQYWAPGNITVTHLDNSKAEEAGGVGCVRTCKVGGMGEVNERIVFKQSPELFAYSMLDNNIFGYSQHLMVVRLKEVKGGTEVTWQLYFNHPNAKAMQAPMKAAFAAAIDKIGSLAK